MLGGKTQTAAVRPGNRSKVSIVHRVASNHLGESGLDLIRRPWHVEAKAGCRGAEAFGMQPSEEGPPAVDTNTLDDGAGVVQCASGAVSVDAVGRNASTVGPRPSKDAVMYMVSHFRRRARI